MPIQEITGTCPTVITSRHCKFNAILHTLAPSHFDNIFEVCGFKNKRQAAEILITIFSDADQTAQENIEVEEIQSFLLQSAICGLRDIPAIMHYIIWAVFTFQSLQESQTEMVSRIIVHLFEYMSTGDRKSIEASTSNIGEQLFQKNSCHPEVFRCSDVMDKYKVLVSKLSRAAFHDVFSTGDQSPLILTESELRNYFLKEELEEALKSGILIQKKVTGSNLQRRMQLSFLCESLQHFFAALHVAGSVGQDRKDLVDKLLKFCLIEDRIYGMENFLLFVFCMVPDLCKVLSQLYFERKLTELTDIKILDRFTCLLKRLMKELDIYNRESTKIYLFYMDAIKLSLTDFSRNDEALILKLYMDNINNLKQLTALTDVVDTSIDTDEQLTRISSYILKHLASASCLVKLHLANIVLVDGGSVLSSLKTLEDLHLENVRNTRTEWITINLTNCTGLQILKCSLLQKMELTVSSTLLEMIYFHNCRSVNLTMQKVSDWYMWFFTNDERRKLKSIDCADLEFCAIDFHDIFMKMDALVLNRCSDCKFTFDHVRLEDDDPVSPKDSSLLDYMPNFNKIWSNPGESKISSINSVNINSCKRVKVSAFVIVSSCVVENCTDIEVLIQSNEKCRDVFAESLEEVSQSFNLKVIVVENIRTEDERSQIKLLRLPVCLEKMLISNCIACDISVDCFDQDDALAKAESYFIKSSPQLDSCLQNNKEVYMDQLMKCDIRMKTTNIALNVVNIKNCQSTTFAFEQVSPNTSLLQNPGHILSLEPIIHKLKISNLADCRLNGLEGAVVKNIILLSCELVWNELGLKDMQSLHIESLPDSAVEKCRSLIGCQSIRNLVCRHISPRMMKALEAIVPSLPNLTSVGLSDKGENIAALVHSLAVCSIDSINFDHVDGKNILELVKYKNLEHLCLNLSDSSCPAVVMKTLPELKHLKGLEFTDCSDDALRALGNLSKELKSVEWFRLSHCHGLGQGSDTTATVLHCVSAMPKLRKLTLVDVPAEVLPALQKYKMKYLETFEIGPVLGEVTTHHFCFLLNQPKLQKVICCRLNSSALCRVMDTVSKMKTGVSVQMNEMGSLIKATLDSLKHVQQVEGLMYQDLQCDSVASVLQNPPSSVKFLCLSGASCVESYGSPQRNSEPEINKVKQVKTSSMTKKHLKGVIQFTWNINTLELSHLNLNSLVIEGMQNLKTIKELKLNGIIEVDVESLGRCIGMLCVEVLTLSNILFKESGLNLSNAYRLRIITLHRVYMHTQFWINFFEKLPKLMDVRESGLVTLLGCKTRKKIGNDNYELSSVICSRNGKSVNNSHKEGSNAFTEATANSQDRNTVISSEGNKNERCCASPIGDHKSEHFSVIYSRTNQDLSKLDAQGDEATTEPVGDSRVSKRSHKLCHSKSTIEVEISDIVDRCNEVTNTETKDNEARSSEAAAKVGYGVARDREALVREPECNVEEPRDMDPHEMEAAAENGERLPTGSEFVFVEKVERKHSTCIKEILLRNVCITQEVICAVSNLGLFSNESWSCIRMTDPAVYDGSLSLMGKK